MWALLGVCTFLTVSVVIPITTVFWRLDHFLDLFDPGVLAVVSLTLRQAFLSAALSAVLGLPLGLWLGAQAKGSRFSRFLEMALALPFGVPSIVAGLSWVVWLGRSGILAMAGVPLDWAYSLKAVILAHVVFNVPWIALLVMQARVQVPQVWIESAENLGASPWAVFRSVLFPGVRWAFWSGLVQTFAFCSMSFALVLVLGGGPPVETLETAIYSKMRYGSLDLSGAASCAVWEVALTLVPWIIVQVMRSREPLFPAEKNPRVKSGDLFPRAAFFVCMIFFLPYLAIFSGFRWTSELFGEFYEPLQISLALAFSTSSFALILVGMGILSLRYLSSRPGWQMILGVFLSLPTGISALVLGLGAWFAYGRIFDLFSGSFIAMALLQVTLFFPIALRILWPVAQASRGTLMETAQVLGASGIQAFCTIEWPRWRAPIAAAFSMIFGASLGEVAAVSLFYNERLIPLPLLISRFMAQYRFDDAQMVSEVLFFLSALTIAGFSLGGNGSKWVRHGG